MSRDEPDPACADLKQYHWRNRLLLLFAESGEDASYRETKAELVRLAADVADRDLVVFEVLERGTSLVNGRPITEPAADGLRKEFKAPAGRFLLVLVGKDGTVKRRSETPVPLNQVFEQIDSMPMRQREMRERRADS
jgi:hypothetical protein